MWKDLKEAAQSGLVFARRVGLIIIGLYLLSGVYMIKPNQVGVAVIMGKVVQARVAPGLHYLLPWPLGRVHKLPAKEVKRILIDDFAPSGEFGKNLFTMITGLDPYLLTGDNNAVNVQVAVQYTVADPFLYLFGTAGQESVLREFVCRELLRTLAVRDVDDILTTAKKEIEELVRRGAQEHLDANRTGLAISAVEIKEVQPPARVEAYFVDVINAQVEKKQKISQAESYRNEQIPRARGAADRLIQEAEAHRDRVVKAAQGESGRFLKNLSEFRHAAEISRQRLYLEFARECLSRLRQVFLMDTSRGAAPARLRLLPSE